MGTQTRTQQKWALASTSLQDAYTDFILSRQAMMCTPRTLKFYEFTLGKIFEWLVHNPAHVGQ
jgi:hypothetical protein